MQIAPLGQLVKDEENDWLIRQPVTIAAFDDLACEFLLEGYENDAHQQDFIDAIENFIALDKAVLHAAQEQIFNYYLDCAKLAKAEREECVDIAAPADIWPHIHYGCEALVCRRTTGDRAVYILFEADCDWNEEEGLQIVFKHGKQISKVGPFDDFLSNEDVYGLPELDRVVYQSRG